MKQRTRLAALACACMLALSTGVARAITHQFTESFTTTTYKDAVNTTADWNTAVGQLKLFPFVPSLTGTYDTPGGSFGVAVAGDLAFVADDLSGLLIFDIINPASPTLVGTYNTPGDAVDVAVAGDLAFVADYATGLVIINITNPASPTLVGTYNTPGSAYGVAVAGDLAFVADQASGLQIISITNPALPTLTGTYDTAGTAYSVAVAGDLAFVADYTSGLQIINIANPASPTLIGTYNTPGLAFGVAVAGDLAFVADNTFGLQIINIANPASPTLTGTYNTPGNAWDLEVTGDLAFVADGSSGLEIINITNPASPTLTDSYDTPGTAYGVVVAGDLAFVGDGNSGLQIIRVGHPVSIPTLAGTYDTPGVANDVAVAGDLAFVADGSALQIVNITTPASPTPVAIFGTPGSAQGVAVAGDLAFVASYDFGLRLINIATPASPTLAGSYNTPGFAYGVAVAGDLAFVADEASGLQIINITNPALPTLTGTYNTPGDALDVVVAGDLAFVADDASGLQIINIVNPASPTVTGTYDTPGSATSVAVAGDLAFVADYTSGLQIISIANPASPTLVGTYNTPGSAYGVALAGDLVLVADLASGLQVINISNPALPTLTGTYNTPGNAFDVVVAGDLAFVADYLSGLQAIQVFQHEVNASPNIGRSLSVGGNDTIRRARLSTTQTAGVSWEVSANAGTNWQTIIPDNAWNAMTIAGSNLLWRSTHAWAGGNPAVSDLHLEWLYDYAAIDAITDIPNDQGRQVRVEWTRSGHDFVGDATQIVEYAVYRKIDPDLGAVTPVAASTFEHLSPAARDNALMMLAAGWDFVTTVPVLTEDSYAVVVPTLKDSTIVAGPYPTTFRITALTAAPGVFFHSPTDSGYSLDNLAPSVPANFAIAFNPGGGSALAWDESPNADFRYFRVYRSSNPNFTPSAGTLVHSTTTNGWVDPDNNPGVAYYKVTATDFSGNESGPANAGTITAIDGPGVPRTFALYPNVPNPFNPTTQIRYDVPESGGDVSLRIYDVSGRVVKTLVSGAQTAGSRSLVWDGRDDAGVPAASGVYFYRLTAPGYTKTHKMVLMK